MFFEFDDFDVRDRFFTIEEKTAKLRLYLESLSPEKQREFKDLCLRAFIFHDSALDGLVVTGEEIASVFNQDGSSPFLRSRILPALEKGHCGTRFAMSASGLRYLVVVHPPSSASVCPLMYPPSSEARKYTAFATSSQVPSRWIGVIS